MWRAMLVGVLAVAATAACGGKPDAPQVDPAAPAGKVLEVSGKVTVGARALVVGDPIKGDDVIETGADGSVVIRLAHNDARWELGPNRKTKPTESQAWTAERSTGPAKAVEQDTSAAGRPAERSAADTSNSAIGGAPTPPREEAAPAPASTGSPAPRDDVPRHGAAPPTASAAPAPPPPSPSPSPRSPAKIASKGAADVGPPDLQPSAGEAKPEVARAPAAPPRPPEAPSTVITAVSTCLTTGHKLTVQIHIANHVPTIKFASGVDAKLKACITKATHKLHVPIEAGDMSVEVTK